MAKLAFSDNNNKNCRHLADTYTQVTCTVFLGLHSITSYDITSAVKGIDNIKTTPLNKTGTNVNILGQSPKTLSDKVLEAFLF